MRLLSLDGGGNLAWADFAQDRLPPYAILSHTWEADEVTFADLTSGHAQKKTGYRKIKFCGEQAARDTLQYFWVDSCCIDKASSAELTEAINSMFRWYHGAVRCYVYLSDVSASASNTGHSIWEADFRKSRWFTRGWTLQELLAPACVEFYSHQHKLLGDKESLCFLIHDITRIPVEALRGHPLHTFTDKERMRWAEGRQTTKDEDGAYCLLGIFNIFMPLIYGEGKDSAFRRLRRELDGLPATASTCFTVPFERNPRFTGRASLLADLESRLFVGEQTTKTAIVGLGGIGKTQIALELAYRTREKYKNCSVFWIPATDTDSLHQAYRDVAQELRIPGWDEEKADVKKLVQEHLSQESARPWLCIFDNADDIGMWIQSPGSEPGAKPGSGGFKEYLPRSKQGCVIFTTRDKKAAVKLAGREVVEVPELDEDAAVQLFQGSLVDELLPGSKQDAETLVVELTCLPLAIVQAAAYINENSVSLRDYVSLLNEQEDDVIELLSEDFEDDWRYQSIKNPVATTWLISFERIRRRDPLAAELLSFMACIDRKDIPQSLLPAGASRKKTMDALGTLKAYSFIVQRSEVTVFDLHRLVHLVTRSWLQREGTLVEWSQAAIKRLDDVFPSDHHQNRTQWRVLLPHAAYTLRVGFVDPEDEHTLNLKLKYAKCLYSDGRYREAEEVFQELLEVRAAFCGDEDPDEKTLTCMAWLASTYQNQGRWKEAEELGKRVIETRKRVLSEEHPNTLTSMANLALTYRNQGRWKEAEELGERVIETSKRVLGEEHPHTLTSMANLASIYRNQGRWKEAEELQAKELEICARVLSEEHPDTLTSMANLALIYRNQGRWKEAEELGKRVIETRKRVLSEEHPDTLTSMANLALIYRNQGRWKEAEELGERVIETSKRVLSEEHPYTLTSMANLASIYQNQGRWKEAEELGERVIEMSKRVLSEEHPDTLTSMANLASIYWNQGRWKEAEELGERVIETSKRVLGEEHPHTLTSMANLASIYRNQGRWKEAEELQAKELEICARVLSEEHPDTLTSMNNLALTWKGQGRDAEAIDLMDKCVRLRERVLGVSHPYTVSSSEALAGWRLEAVSIDDVLSV